MGSLIVIIPKIGGKNPLKHFFLKKNLLPSCKKSPRKTLIPENKVIIQLSKIIITT
jgi:hypothetical protein